MDLITQTFFGIYAVSDPLLYENRVVEGHEGVHQRSGGLRRINTKRACVDPVIYNRLDDRCEMLLCAPMIAQFCAVAATTRS
ncbi:hypothetical protein HNR29_004505 [Rhizobium leguminosarum]|nr:hypothetical protein [Rhizobium leguminosarum]